MTATGLAAIVFCLCCATATVRMAIDDGCNRIGGGGDCAPHVAATISLYDQCETVDIRWQSSTLLPPGRRMVYMYNNTRTFLGKYTQHHLLGIGRMLVPRCSSWSDSSCPIEFAPYRGLFRKLHKRA